MNEQVVAEDWVARAKALFVRLAFHPGPGEPPCWCDGAPDHDEPHDVLCEDIRALLSQAPEPPETVEDRG